MKAESVILAQSVLLAELVAERDLLRAEVARLREELAAQSAPSSED